MTARCLRRIRPVLLIGVTLALACSVRTPGRSVPRLALDSPERVAAGVEHFALADPGLLDPPGPISVHLLRLDMTRVRLQSALGGDQVMGLETVRETAIRHGAIAAINAGFFYQSGDPDGVLKLDGLLVSDRTNRWRAAVAILDPAPGGSQALVVDQLMVSASVAFEAEGRRHVVPIAGIDTTRLRGRLMLFTPRYYPDTDTAPAGTEWTLRGAPLEVRTRRSGVGKTPIPGDGFVLSFGGVDPVAPLDQLTEGREVTIDYAYETRLGTSPQIWANARQIVGGAGLLIRDGRRLADWDVERFRDGFATDRHPRTMIGVDESDAVWLITVDGRQQDISLGMTLAELQRLAGRIGLRDAVNLDGGGSTTMVLGNRVVNRPSDPTGPRRVSDALLVMAR